MMQFFLNTHHYFRNNFVNFSVDKHFEACGIKIKMFICCLYRSPSGNINTFINNLENVLNILNIQNNKTNFSSLKILTIKFKKPKKIMYNVLKKCSIELDHKLTHSRNRKLKTLFRLCNF